jgi:hypothetical protein
MGFIEIWNGKDRVNGTKGFDQRMGFIEIWNGKDRANYQEGSTDNVNDEVSVFEHVFLDVGKLQLKLALSNSSK